MHYDPVSATPLTVGHQGEYVVKVRSHAVGVKVHGMAVGDIIFSVYKYDHHDVIANVPLAFQLWRCWKEKGEVGTRREGEGERKEGRKEGRKGGREREGERKEGRKERRKGGRERERGRKEGKGVGEERNSE